MSSKRILVVEDDAGVREACVDILGSHGLDAVGAQDGAAALADIARTAPDLILLDLLMPRATVDGLTFLSRVATSPAAHTPIVILSALGEELAREITGTVTAELHIAAILAKPFDPRTLIQEVERILSIGISV
jgi:CheY-like chemotaxis protein